jgi:hypothetical protein
MLWRLVFPMLVAAVPAAWGDDLVSMTQVAAAQAAGVLPQATGGYNFSAIYQTGIANMARTDQTGLGDYALITQTGNNLDASILQTSQHDSATVTQTGNGIGAQPITVTQTGPAQSVIITMHR